MKTTRSARRALAVLLGVALSLAVATAPAAASETITRDETAVSLEPSAAAAGPYYLQFYHSKKCAEVPGASRVWGVWLDQYTCLAQNNVRWYLDPQFIEGGLYWYRIRNVHSGLCMNVKGGSQVNGAAIVQWDCANDYGEPYANGLFAVWRYDSMVDGQFFVEAYHSGKVLNISGGSTANGGKLIQYTRCFCGNSYVKLI